MADNIVSADSEFHESSSNVIDIAGDIHVTGISSDEEEQSTLDEPISKTLVSYFEVLSGLEIRVGHQQTLSDKLSKLSKLYFAIKLKK